MGICLFGGGGRIFGGTDGSHLGLDCMFGGLGAWCLGCKGSGFGLHCLGLGLNYTGFSGFGLWVSGL